MYKVQKPKFDAVDERSILKSLSTSLFRKFVNKTYNDSYLYWNKIKHLPRPKELTQEEFWLAIKCLRRNSFSLQKTPIQTEKKENFTWQHLERYKIFTDNIDSMLSNYNDKYKSDITGMKRYIRSGMIEESIASSQLEGANTTRKIAKELIIKRGYAKDASEQMILNNYNTMLFIQQELKDEELDLNLLLEIHKKLLINTISSDDIGRFRIEKDNIVVSDAVENVTYHIPPSESFLKKELNAFIHYANDKTDKSYLHPVIKAIIIHFWIGYLHPFIDGNGRIARALFYWYLLRNDYWFFSYIPLSTLIKKSKGQYRDAYIYSEQDENDLTYFIDYNIKMINKSVVVFEKYVEKKESERINLNKVRIKGYSLNKRQLEILHRFNTNSDESTTIKEHSKIFEITRMTARKDLYDLEKLKLVKTKKIGKFVHFYATENINELFK